VTPATSLPESPRGRQAALGLDALPVPAVAVRPDGTVLDANAAALALLPADPRGQELALVLPQGGSRPRTGRWRTELTGCDGVPFLVDVHLGPPVAGGRVALVLRSRSRRC